METPDATPTEQHVVVDKQQQWETEVECRPVPDPVPHPELSHLRSLPPLAELTRSASSPSLFSALDDHSTTTRRQRATSPPPHYNPYPYNRSWTLHRFVTAEEQRQWHNREDEWLKYTNGEWNLDLRRRIWNKLVAAIRRKQYAAKKQWENQQVHEKPPAVPPAPTELEHERLPVDAESPIDHRFDLEFMTVDNQKGFPVRALLSGRRAIERMMQSAKGKVFENYSQDNIWVRIKVGPSSRRVPSKSSR